MDVCICLDAVPVPKRSVGAKSDGLVLWHSPAGIHESAWRAVGFSHAAYDSQEFAMRVRRVVG